MKLSKHKSQVNQPEPVVLHLLEAATYSSDAMTGQKVSAIDDSPLSASRELIPLIPWLWSKGGLGSLYGTSSTLCCKVSAEMIPSTTSL